MGDWQSILTEYGAAVWRTVYRVLNDHADALDCYQETFVAAWRFAERERVVDWDALLISLATRRAIDRLRQRVRERGRQTPLDDVAEYVGRGPDPVAHAQASELMDLVREGMAQLPDKQAEVFWLSCIEGQSHQRISTDLNLPPGEVRVLLHRARVRLARAIETRLLEKEDNP